MGQPGTAPIKAPAGGARAWLQLTRPANVVTAWADVLAGFAVATAAARATLGAATAGELFFLLCATTGLYAGGVVLNDVFDADLDLRERPERPIPSGAIRRRSAALLGGVLLSAGVVFGFAVSAVAGTISVFVALCAVLYDGWAKHWSMVGPLNMGLCRAGNLMMGAAAVPAAIGEHWYLAFIPLAYIAAITIVSRGEVHGGTPTSGAIGVALIVAVLAVFPALWIWNSLSMLDALPFLIVFAVAVVPAFANAALKADAPAARRAVRAGVLFLIMLDASIAAGYGGWIFGIFAAALLPLSMWLARRFSVT